jgi:RNA polymerase sigma-70 factor, ECF subfamily
MDATQQQYADASDELLVRRIEAGDELALSVLYRRYVTAIYRFVLAQLRDVDEAEDLTSETFARMLRGLAGFRGEASFKNWLYQIARNAIRTHRRAAHYRRQVPLSPHLAAPVEPTEGGRDQDRSQAAVLELLQPLPPRYRQVLEIRFLEGRTIEDTADQLGISVANAKVLQHRALRKAALMAEVKASATGRE